MTVRVFATTGRCCAVRSALDNNSLLKFMKRISAFQPPEQPRPPVKKTTSLFAATLLCWSATCSWAQTAPAKPASAATKSAGKPKRSAPAAANLTPQASQEQLDAAERTHFGDYACEFNQTVHVSLHPTQAGYVEVKHLKKVFVMRPVMSSTGALRLEDVRGQTLMLQIANKSMLMDTKAGRRLVDNCVHDIQREFMKNAPPATPVLN